MRILVSWLGDYLEWTGKPGELARLLTEVGLPVTGSEVVPPDEATLGDCILDVEVTRNRGDCLSHLGLAREVAAATGQPCRAVVQPTDPPPGAPEEASSAISVAVEAPDLCPAYVARVLLGADNRRPTPGWIARRLRALGHRLVNPVVDVTNFVLLGRGQPLHAFDRSKLRGGRILVRRSREGESIETIDGRRRLLPAGLLVIADAERPVAVAGVMGSRDTEVGPATTEIVLESARFAPAAVRASAAALGLATEASARFARRVDPLEADVSSRRAAALLVEVVGGRVATGAVAAGPQAAGPPPAPVIDLRFARLNRLLGSRVPREEVIAILASLAVEVVAREKDLVRVRPPSHREDLVLEEDMVEEVARLRGYARIPATVSIPVRPVVLRRGERAVEHARRGLAAAGWHEALTLPFTAPGPVDDASPWTTRPALRVDNPTRSEEPLLRRSLLGPLLRCLARNRARGAERARLFELGVAFLPAGSGPRPEERLLLSGAVEGGFADARGAVEAVAEALGLGGRLEAGDVPPGVEVRPLDPERTARLTLGGKTAGFAGELRPEDMAALGAQREGLLAAAFELDWAVLEDAAVLDRPAALAPVHPVATRDLAFVLPGTVRWAALAACVRESAGPLLRDLALFDEYRGGGVPAGDRSLAFRMTFGAADRTLRGEEVDGAVASVAEAVRARLGGRIRA